MVTLHPSPDLDFFLSLLLLQLEMAATVHWGEPFVKASYYLEGDGALAVDGN